jgi:hypothetical protein
MQGNSVGHQRLGENNLESLNANMISYTTNSQLGSNLPFKAGSE